MADGKTAELLISWGLGDLVDTFKEQGIDYDALTSLLGNDKEVEQLIPKIGLRLKFKKQLYHLISQNCPKRADSMESLPSTVSLTSSMLTSSGQDSPCASDNIFNDLLDIEADLLPGEKYLFTNKIKDSSSINETDLLNTNNEETNPSDLPMSKTKEISSTIIQDSTSVNNENRPPSRNTTSIEVQTQTNILGNLAQLDLKKLLLDSPNGSFVLSLYERNKCLDKSTRLRLVQTIIRSIMQKLPVHARETMKNDHFSILAKKVVELFPAENEKIYYILPFAEGPEQQISKGKLVVRYRNELREFRKCGFFVTKKSKSKSQTEKTISSDHDDLSEENIRQCTIHFDWLKHNTAPWSSIEEHWLASQPLRFKEYRSEGDVRVFFERWPVLKQPSGHSLLEKDFSGMFDDRLSMYAEWLGFSQKLQQLMQTEVKGQHYRNLLALLDSDTVSEGARDVIILTLLPALCPPVCRIKKGRGFWKPTIVESLNGFIRHVKTPGDLNQKSTNA